jgi:hypothetical protein
MAVNGTVTLRRKSGWHRHVIESTLWLLPLALALLGHFTAWPKAGLSDAGPGFHIMMNERTVRAQDAWHFLNSHWWLLIVYGVLLVGVCLLEKAQSLWWPLRLATLAVLAIPGLWYFRLTVYLGNKVLMW